jgi:hypothetical protein
LQRPARNSAPRWKRSFAAGSARLSLELGCSKGRCAVIGIAQPELLRASHIKPWAHCGNNAECLDVHNGFLVTADWDAAFDAGLVSFDTDGVAVFNPALSQSASSIASGNCERSNPEV